MPSPRQTTTAAPVAAAHAAELARGNKRAVEWDRDLSRHLPSI